MAFDVHAPRPAKKRDSTDDMVALGHMAGQNPKTKRIQKGPLVPRESRRALFAALGMIALLLVVVLLRARA